MPPYSTCDLSEDSLYNAIYFQVGKTLLALGQNSKTTIYPISQKKSLEEIAAELNPCLQVSPPHRGTEKGVEATWDVIAEDGSRGWIHYYPDQKLATDASLFVSGKSRGSLLVHIICNFAFNNGFQWEGDRQGLSKMGRIRAAELMLSSAVHFQTTKHLNPAENLKEEGEEGEPAIFWEEGNDILNIGRLAEVCLTNTKIAVPEITRFQYNFDTKHFEEMNSYGKTKRRQRWIFDSLAFTQKGARKAAIGGTTLARAVLIQSLRDYFFKEFCKKCSELFAQYPLP